jgi:5-amino-6-(5-phosphoribosylamino)uracil reductase
LTSSPPGVAEFQQQRAQVDFGARLDDLGARRVCWLMVEGGTTIHTQSLTGGLADEIQLVVAPFFVGDPAAHKWSRP